MQAFASALAQGSDIMAGMQYDLGNHICSVAACKETHYSCPPVALNVNRAVLILLDEKIFFSLKQAHLLAYNKRNNKAMDMLLLTE